MRRYILDEIKRVAGLNGATLQVAPNQLQSKASVDFLVSKFAEACRHHGKIPTEGELRIYARSDPAFPSHSTFFNRFSMKAELLRNLREWVVKAGDYDDVLAMLPEPAAAPIARTPRLASHDGFVYLLRSGAHYKIGNSDEIEQRLKEIKVALPEATILGHTIVTDDPSGIEAGLLSSLIFEGCF
jgi:hypothetical protein